ncbi:MAG: hypothetical protein H0V44_17610 [Planctomycetes bacterium]|nr:hypothetical protein [Planctomycetota bacterium]
MDAELLERTWTTAIARGEPAPALVQLVLRADAEALVDAFAEADDLDSGLWLLPRLHVPRRDYRTPGLAALDDLAKRVPADADGGVIADFLCNDCGFVGDHQDYDNPLNSLMPWVLERRIGLPISLTVLWVLVGRRLGIELDAIALPKHVLGRWRGGYIDMFEGGRMVTREELDSRVGRFDGSGAAPYLAPASDRALLRRMARNLASSYQRRDEKVRATIAHGLATS